MVRTTVVGIAATLLVLVATFHPVIENPPFVSAGDSTQPVSRWLANGTAVDSIDGNNGTLEGNTAYVTGIAGQAFGFDGVNDRVLIGNPANLQLQTFTIEGWIKRSSTTDTSLLVPFPEESGVIYGWGQGGPALTLIGQNSSVGGLANGELILTKVGIDYVASGTLRVTDLLFHHVAVVVTGTQVTFYVDGVGGPPLSYVSNFSFTTNAASGDRGDATASSPYGAVDSLAVWDRPLSAAEIRAIAYTDGDGYLDAAEALLGEDFGTFCPIMRADVGHDGNVSILDIAAVAANFGQSVPPAPERQNQGPPGQRDSTLSILDIAANRQRLRAEREPVPERAKLDSAWHRRVKQRKAAWQLGNGRASPELGFGGVT